MRSSASTTEIFLRPGELYFGAGARVRTLLGSCVSITLWHPGRRIGGMCHYMLPTRGMPSREPDPRYADEAVALFLREIGRIGSRPAEYVVKLFGGGNMFPAQAPRGGALDVPTRNVEAARLLMRQHGFIVAAEHLGGSAHRHLVFDSSCGATWLRQPGRPGGKGHVPAEARTVLFERRETSNESKRGS